MKNTVYLNAFFMCLILSAFNSVSEEISQNKEIEKIDVHGVRARLTDSGSLKDSISRTEILTDEYIENTQAASLADAITNAIGIRVSNECSMCGAKRILINGL